ncbi:MAG: hypothetical protein R3211_07485 [Balneolaceae bacterium]|nr:hypothetical protein [Balneolaceae bacterium]
MFVKIFLINAVCTLFMTGLIWFVQLVQYPGFTSLDPPSFLQFHYSHVYRIAWLVIPVMVAELATSIILVVAYELFFDINLIGLALLLLIWASTFALQMPIHRKLREETDLKLIKKLIFSNWIRTLAWSLKSALSIYGLMLLIP